MKLLFLDSPSYGKLDIISEFKRLGHTVVLFNHNDLYEFNSTTFNHAFDDFITNQAFDFAFSFNFFPSISNGCMRNGIKYISFVYDSPQVSLYSYTIINPCNYVFIFDKTQYLELQQEGIKTVYYLPLCINAIRLSNMKPFPDNTIRYQSDVSFVGSLYNEEHNLFDRMTSLSDRTIGYLNGIMEAQLKVNGYFFIPELLTPEVLTDMKQSQTYIQRPDGVESDTYIYANYFIARKLTAMERERLLSKISSHFETKLYTYQPTPNLPNCQNMGPVDYYSEMPYVFRNSKINLNITLRSIQSGIPLRAFDILGAGGFLLSNYQADFMDCYVPGEDFVFYDDASDLITKIEYFLSHEKERKEISQNALQKTLSQHTYEKRIQTMLDIAFH